MPVNDMKPHEVFELYGFHPRLTNPLPSFTPPVFMETVDDDFILSASTLGFTMNPTDRAFAENSFDQQLQKRRNPFVRVEEVDVKQLAQEWFNYNAYVLSSHPSLPTFMTELGLAEAASWTVNLDEGAAYYQGDSIGVFNALHGWHAHHPAPTSQI